MSTSGLLLTLLALTPNTLDRAPPLASIVGPEAPMMVELTDGARLLDLTLESELWKKVRGTPEGAALYSSPEARRAKSGLAMFAGLLGQSSEDAVRSVFGREVAAAITPRGEGDAAVVIATRLPDPAEAARLSDVVHQFLTLVTEGDGYDDAGPIKTVNGTEFHATLADCFLISNDRDALVAALDRADDATAGVAPAAPGDAARLVARADLEWLRRVKPEAALPVRFDNAVGALLAHGFNTAANRASRATAVLDATSAGLDLAVAFDAEPTEDAAWTRPSAPPTPWSAPTGTIASLTLRRDVAEFYARRLELLDPSNESKIVEFDNVISIFFGGRSFGEEVLPALGDRMTLLVGEQRFLELPTPPDVRLPGFTLVAPLDVDALTKNNLLVAFQTAVGIVNADRAQNGLASLMLSTERLDGVDVSSARYMLDDDEEARELRMNASPAIAVVDDHLVIGSARDHVIDVIAAIRRGDQAPGDEGNSLLTFDVPNLRTVLEANLDSLIANRMLEEGENRAEAEAFWRRADQVLSLIRSGTVRLASEQGSTTLRLTLLPADASAPAGAGDEVSR